MTGEHISDDDLERYCLGRIKDQAELAPLEEHLLACPTCVERAEREQELVDRVRTVLKAEGRSLD
jgi:anti-sigma factor RsiW